MTCRRWVTGTSRTGEVVERRQSRQRVLVIVQNLPVPLDRRVWMEAQALTAAGYGVSVICPRGPGEPYHRDLEGVRIRTYPAPPATHGLISFAWEFAWCWAATAVLALVTALRDGVDAVQACNPPDTYWTLGWIFRRFGRPFVYDQHDLCPEILRSRFGESRRLLLRALTWLERMTYRTADHVVSPNESYRDVALRRGGRREDEVTVVRSGPDPARMRRAAPEPALRHGRDHLLVWLGIMGPQDGCDLLLDTVDVLVHERGRSDVHTAILGFGDCLEELRSRAHALGLDDHVTFTGRADLAMISTYLSTASVGLGPDPSSPLNDVSTMNKIMEYMAYELPIACFDLPETRRTAGEAALHVSSGDVHALATAVERLLDDSALRQRMGRIGRARIEGTLGWHEQAPPYVAVYDRLLGSVRSTVLT